MKVRAWSWMTSSFVALASSLALGCASPPAGEDGSGESGATSESGASGGTEESSDTSELMCGSDVLSVAGQQLQIVDVLFSSVGIGGGQFADLAQLELEGNVFLTLQFLQDTTGGETITIVPEPDATQGAFVINYAGFEGGPQDLCDRNGQNGAVAGSFSFEQLVRDDSGAVEAVCGDLELQFTNCNFAELGIMGDVTFMGAFRG